MLNLTIGKPTFCLPVLFLSVTERSRTTGYPEKVLGLNPSKPLFYEAGNITTRPDVIWLQQSGNKILKVGNCYEIPIISEVRSSHVKYEFQSKLNHMKKAMLKSSSGRKVWNLWNLFSRIVKPPKIEF